MAVAQNSDDKYRRMSRRSTEIGFELDDLSHREDLIKAKHTRDIWRDHEFDKEKLRLAELTLRVEADPEYQATRKRERELLLELDNLEMEMRFIEEEKFARRLPRDENDMELDQL